MHHLAVSKGGKCLSSNYVNTNTHLLWECSCGTKWRATPANVKKGKWCPLCGAKAAWDKRGRLSITDMHNLAKENFLVFLDSTCKGSRHKHVWKCKNGHQFESTPSSVKTGKGCPYCHRYIREEQCRFLFETFTGLSFPRRKVGGYELDGFCSSINLAFEHQGEQHYRKTNWHKTLSDFRNQISRDKSKARYCEENGITLVVVPFTESSNKDRLQSYIEDTLSKLMFLQTNLVDWSNFIGKSNDLSRLQQICKSKHIECLSDSYTDSQTALPFRCLICDYVWQTCPSSIVHQHSGCNKCASASAGKKIRKYNYGVIAYLRNTGMSFAEIAEKVGGTVSGVHYAFDRS